MTLLRSSKPAPAWPFGWLAWLRFPAINRFKEDAPSALATMLKPCNHEGDCTREAALLCCLPVPPRQASWLPDFHDQTASLSGRNTHWNLARRPGPSSSSPSEAQAPRRPAKTARQRAKPWQESARPCPSSSRRSSCRWWLGPPRSAPLEAGCVSAGCHSRWPCH